MNLFSSEKKRDLKVTLLQFVEESSVLHKKFLTLFFCNELDLAGDLGLLTNLMDNFKDGGVGHGLLSGHFPRGLEGLIYDLGQDLCLEGFSAD